MPASDEILLVDGTLDFSGGVNSIKPTTAASEINPGGLARNELAWLINATARDGGLQPRGAWLRLGRLHGPDGKFQGAFLYQPSGDNPYLVASVSGRIFTMLLEPPFTVRDLSAEFALINPAGPDIVFFVQAEEFLIIQAGDFETSDTPTLPLFWDGETLTRSSGITNDAVAPGTPGVNEIPAASSMVYYMGRLWYAQFRQFSAGDIVGGQSGTLARQFRDAVLNVTENPLVLGGDGFTVPEQSGNIRALAYNGNLDSTTGQGLLFIFTRRSVYSMRVPVTRQDWINADAANQPEMNVVQLINGAVSDRSVVPINGDLFYQSLEAGIRSLISAQRDFTQWGNSNISANVNRVMQFVNRGLVSFANGMEFDNRLLQATLPEETQQGVIHRVLVPLDFVPISSFAQAVLPVWEGVYEGLGFLQVLSGDFGRERAFAAVVSDDDSGIDVWEITDRQRFDEGDRRITWVVETCSFNWNRPFDMKRLVGGEVWIDRLFGTADFTVEYRPDGETCWFEWHRWQECCARTEDEVVPAIGLENGYPVAAELGESYRQTMSLPKPPEHRINVGNRISVVGYQFQVRLTVKGYCRLRGMLLHAARHMRKLYSNLSRP